MSSPTETEGSIPNDSNTRHHRRQTFYGLGDSSDAEKNAFGRFLDDTVYAFTEVSVLSLPALWWVLLFAPTEYFGVKSATLLAWLAMTLGVALFRGRLISLPGTNTDGWISLAPSLVLFRIAYYNVALMIAGYTGGFIGTTAGSALGSTVIAVGLGAGAIAAVPWVSDRFQRWVAERDFGT